MSVELVNGHVLLPNSADWSTPPKWSRRWENEIADGVTGAESRAALRATPRQSLNYRLTPASIVTTQMLDDRLRAALKTGLACAPMWGRGCEVAASVLAGVSSITVRDAFDWQAGDYLFLGDENNSDAMLVTAAVLALGIWTLTLDDPLTLPHLAGSLAWPLLFGKPAVGDLEAVTQRLAPVAITITELVAARAAQLGAVTPPVGTGIGVMAVGSTFIIG